MVNNPDPPSVEELHKVFMSDGVPLAVRASRKAIAEAQVDLEHIVSLSRIVQAQSSNGPGVRLPVHKTC